MVNRIVNINDIFSSRWNINNNMVYNNTSNVGIGTSNPVSKLHVYDKGNVTQITIQHEGLLPSELVITNGQTAISGIIGSDRYTIFTYKGETAGAGSRSTLYTITTNPSESIVCDILVVGGGGGGAAGGGGGGGYVYVTDMVLGWEDIRILVGDGGAGMLDSDTVVDLGDWYDENNTRKGQDSRFFRDTVDKNYQAYGGGRGGRTNEIAPSHAPDIVGSYGGNGHNITSEQTYSPAIVNVPTLGGVGVTQGNKGGTGTTQTSGSGGGGGGAGFKGENSILVNGLYAKSSTPQESYHKGGQGGNGILNYITGVPVYYGGGGTAGANTNFDTDSSEQIAPLGGGGKGSRSPNGNGFDGTSHTGGGGGGGDIERTRGAKGGSGIVIIRYRKNNIKLISSLELVTGVPNDRNVDYSVGNYNGDFKIISSLLNTLNERIVLTSNGYVGIGTTSSTFLLEIGANTGSTGSISQRYFNSATTLTPGTITFADVSMKVNGTIWTTSTLTSSSDSRIKEDIQDINDNSALNMILAIEPKTYKYIDKINKGYNTVYGFIAQQIREIIPEATSIKKSYIPNIMLLAVYNDTDSIVTLPLQPTNIIIKHNDKIKCYDINNTEINVKVVEVIDELSFRIKALENYTDTKIFVYGTEIDDFHTLDKTYIFTLNVCATQELHRKIEAQDVIIKSQDERINSQEVQILSQNERINELETKIERLLNNMLL